MKIISLNAWHGTQEVELREFLTNQVDSTDVFCLQEADGVLVEQIFHDVLSELKFHEISATKVASRDPDCLRTFVRYGIEIAEHVALLGESGNESGYSLVVHLRDKNADIYIANTHGAPRPGDKLDTPGRIAQSRDIIDYLNEQSGVKVVCGDLNLQPDTESIALFERAGFLNLIADYGITTTRNDLAWRRYPESKQLFADYVFVSHGTSVENFTVPQNLVSDHLPLIVEFDVLEGEASIASSGMRDLSMLPAARR